MMLRLFTKALGVSIELAKARRFSYRTRVAVWETHARSTIERRCLDPRTWATIISQIEGIKHVYGFMNKFMSLGFENRVRINAIDAIAKRLGNLSRQLIIVDVGSGPGDSLRAIWRRLTNSYIVAIDPSISLLSTACNNVLCDRVVGVAENLPIRRHGADIVTSFYASRDFQSLSDALASMISVTRRGLVIGDIFLPKHPVKKLLVKAWVCYIVPMLAMLLAGKYWKNYKVLCVTIKDWCDVQDVKKYLKQLLKRFGKQFIVESHSYVFGGLGYVTAFIGKESIGGHNWS